MKDFCEIYKDQYGTKYYYNEKDDRHRLIGPAIEWLEGDKSYCINGILYMDFYKNKNDNELYINSNILKLILEYEVYIKQNIKYLISEYNPKIGLSQYFKKEKINELPNWIKDLIIL